MQRNDAEERAFEEAERARRAAWQSQPIDPADRMTGTELFYGVLTVLFVLAAVAMLVWGFLETGHIDSAIQQAALFAAGAVFGILARLAQAARLNLEARRRQR